MKRLLIISSLLAVAACGSEGENSSAPAQAPEASKAEQSSETTSLVDKAQEAAAEAMQALKLDGSSLEGFKSSLSNMKASLTPEQANQLTDALSSMVKSDSEEGGAGALLGAAKDVATGKSLEETLFEKLGDQLHGLSFEEILAKAS